VTGDLLGNLLHERVVDFLIGRLLGGWLGGGWRRLLPPSFALQALPSNQDHPENR
jgi:hypothetical protein